MTCKVHQIQVELDKKTANLAIQLPSGGSIFMNGLSYDHPGDQTESELRHLVIKAAMKALHEAVAVGIA